MCYLQRATGVYLKDVGLILVPKPTLVGSESVYVFFKIGKEMMNDD